MAQNGHPMPGGARRRAAHGRKAQLGATLTYEAPALGEVRTAPEGAADPIAHRGNGTFTPAGAAAAARRRADLERMPDFAERELEFIPVEAFAPFDEARRELTRATGSYLATSNGGLSCNVWPTVRGACPRLRSPGPRAPGAGWFGADCSGGSSQSSAKLICSSPI